jgi:light-regulated signal transduction histidine kinase (bacteriophytochrome)
LITQVFQNLIGNALKFRGEACPIITITAEHLQDRWVMGVKDNGIGIEPQYGELIFAPFKRLHSIREFPGSGIGLAVARRVIERHGGVIWVESAPGQGAHFRFTLGTWKGTQNVYDAQETRGDSPH